MPTDEDLEPIRSLNSYDKHVQIFHTIADSWFEYEHSGNVICGNILCGYERSGRLTDNANIIQRLAAPTSADELSVLIVNRDVWGQPYTPSCRINTNLTLIESMEPPWRTDLTLEGMTPYDFDGTVSPISGSTVQRFYADNSFYKEKFLPARDFSDLVKGASFVASNCNNEHTHRDEVVLELRNQSLIVDGLGHCDHTANPNTPIVSDNKLAEISHYMFNIAFENSFEKGYVTEKAFDALLAGSPIVLAVISLCFPTVIPRKFLCFKITAV